MRFVDRNYGQLTLEDLCASLDFAHSNIETLKNQVKRQEGLRIRQAEEILALILKAKSAREVKKISKGISLKPEWDMQKEEIMMRVIEAKFNQNELLARKLVETGNKRLIKATMDRYWGAFATPTAKSITQGTWKGANHFGILLMELRNELRREYPDAILNRQHRPNLWKWKFLVTNRDQTNVFQSPAQPPVAPSRYRRNNKRRMDERSPPVLPASQYQIFDDMNTSHRVPTTESPNKQAIIPPIADLFALPEEQLITTLLM